VGFSPTKREARKLPFWVLFYYDIATEARISSEQNELLINEKTIFNSEEPLICIPQINSRQSTERREIRIEIGQAIDRGRLPKVFPATCMLLIEHVVADKVLSLSLVNRTIEIPLNRMSASIYTDE